MFACAFSVVTLIGFVSLAVDVGHVQDVKTELWRSADAAARAGVSQLQSGSGSTQIANARALAIQIAAMNLVDNQPTVLQSGDIVVGNWDATQTPNFSATRTPVNAVQVAAHHCAARGTAVQLTMASILGFVSCDANVSTTATLSSAMSNYGIVGINHVNFGSLGVLACVNGDVASAGNISIGNPLGLLVQVTGNAQSTGGAVSHGSMAEIEGSTSPLPGALSYPAVQLPASNDNSRISPYLDPSNNFVAAGVATIPSGTYVVHDLNIPATLDLNLEGAVTFYVSGSFNMGASVNLLGSTNTLSSNFAVNVAQGGSVNFIASILTPLAMDLYAPQSAITINVGIGSYIGQLIGKSLDVNLPIAGSFTEVKPWSTESSITLVQ